MLVYTSNLNQTYSLRTLPLDRAEWGPNVPGTSPDQNPSNFLHVDGQAVTLWLVGELIMLKTKTKLPGTNHIVNARKAYVGIEPFHANDAVLASELMATRSLPTGMSSLSVQVRH